MVTVLPEMVAGPDSTLNDTGRPEVAVAFTLNGRSPKVLFPGVLKLIVWLPIIRKLADVGDIPPPGAGFDTVIAIVPPVSKSLAGI